jgi:hypothetical protein
MLLPGSIQRKCVMNWSKQLAPFLERPVMDVYANLLSLSNAYKWHNIKYCLDVINQFPPLPGYPYMIKADFTDHMEYLHRYLEMIAGKDTPKVPFIAYPKTASSFVCVVLCKLLDILPTSLSFDHIKGMPAWANGFGKWGGITHEHYYPSPENIKLLYDAGIRKCVIHNRHPMNALISFSYHMVDEHLNYSKKQLADPDQRIQLVREYIDSQIENMIRRHGAWQRAWQREAAAGRMEILETSYEDMKSDQLAFFKRILNFYGIAYDQQALEATLQACRPGRFKQLYNFRKAAENEWQEVLTPKQADRAKKIIIEEFPGSYV